MKLALGIARDAERNALVTAPRALPEHAGLARYRAKLAADLPYRRALGLALALALLAGTDLGRLAARIGGPEAGLWAMIAAVLAGRVLVPGQGPASAGALHGWSLATTVAQAAAAGGLLVSMSSLPAILDGKPVAWALVEPWGLAAVVVLVGRISQARRWPVDRLLHYALAAAWVAAVGLARSPDAVAQGLGVAAALVGLDLLVVRHPGFLAAVAVTIFLHLAGLLVSGPDLTLTAWQQLLFAVAETGLLVEAGFRDALAALWQLPRATYRIAPLCVVPRLDRAQDHPVRIDVA